LVVESTRIGDGSVFALIVPLALAAGLAAGRVADKPGGVEELVTIS
jgi:hypothetical protein